jgi:hypothetical protein
MRRYISSFAFALGCMAIAAQAQETTVKKETRSSGGQVQTVSYTGCVQTGTQAKTYILNKVVPVSRTTTEEFGGKTTTTTAYALVPAESIQVQQHVGHKVEVTGTLIPAGEVKTETRTRIEREDGDDTKTRERTESNNPYPQFRVTSIKTLSDTCE